VAAHLDGFLKRWMRTVTGTILAAALVTILTPLAARAQCTVTTLADTSAPGSLRSCVTAANATSGETINFASSLNGGTITLIAGPLSISASMTIAGPGPNLLTISGSNATEIFNITSGTVTISGLTIANGNSTGIGGGIVNSGTLTLTNCTVSGSTATAEGGGIYNAGGTLTVNNGTFSGNSSNDGGGIFSDHSTLIVNNSTFSGNTATSGGSGIYNKNSTLTVNNSTFSGNTAGSGGAIYNSGGTLTVNNSILTGDTGGECSGTGCPSNGSNGNVVDTTPAQPILAPLGWYGGSTQTMLPLPGPPGSTAICAGSVSLIAGGLTTDQRGFARLNLASGCVDSGAVQTNYLFVTTTTDVVDVSPACDAAGDTPCSLRDALTLAASNGSADIAFASGVTGTINLSTGTNTPLPSISGNLDLFGPGPNNLTVSGGNSSSVSAIFVVASTNAAISGITIANGSNTSSSTGGGIHNVGMLTVNDCTFSGNTATDFGGGIFTQEGMLTVSNSTFSGGNAATIGGGIFSFGSTLIVINSTISGNIANVEGGGILNDGGTSTVNNSTVFGNTAADAGGGIENYSGTLTLSNSIVAGNTTINAPGDDCDSCGTQSNSNLINTTSNMPPINPLLAPLGSYGGPTQTMLPLPGSPAICAGSPSLDPAGLLYDQRGFPRLNITYTGYSANAPCLDLGADQTNYSSVQFTNGTSGYGGQTGMVVFAPAPVVSVTENGQNIGGVPVTLSFSGTAPSSVSGTGPVTTVAGTGAQFPSLTVSPGGSYTLEASLAITSSITISNTAALTIGTPAKVLSVTSSASGTYTTTAVINITVNFNQSVKVFGPATLALNSGGTAYYSSGSPGSALVFKYTVAAPQSSADLDVASSSALSGTIQNNVPANLTLPTGNGTGALGAAGIVINTTQYTLTILVNPSGGGTVQASPPSTPNVTPALPAGTYLPGTYVTLTATAKSPYIFSSWTGTTNSNSNPLFDIKIISPVTEQANFAGPTTTIGSVSQSPAVYGEPVELIAQVSNGTSTPPNGGTVTFKNGSTIVGSGTVSHGVAVYSMNGLQVPAGGNPTIAYYSGDSTDQPSQSVSFEFLVIAEATTTTVTYSPIPAVHNKNLTLTATVKPQYSGTPTGTVTFTENGGTPVTVTLVNGTASYSFYPSQAGTFAINAVYNAPIDGNFNLSSGSVKLAIQ
jgi:predicted outer membrane repeat protein